VLECRYFSGWGGATLCCVRLPRVAVLAGSIRKSNSCSALSDANQQLEGLEKHQKSSGLLASLMVTLFTVWV
jgi:hypothetical protein